MPSSGWLTVQPTTLYKAGIWITALKCVLYYAVGDWAKALLYLGKLRALLNLTHKGVVQEDNHAASVGKLNLKSATVCHDAAHKTSLADELTTMVSHLDFVVEEDVYFIHNLPYTQQVPCQVVGRRQRPSCNYPDCPCFTLCRNEAHGTSSSSSVEQGAYILVCFCELTGGQPTQPLG